MLFRSPQNPFLSHSNTINISIIVPVWSTLILYSPPKRNGVRFYRVSLKHKVELLQHFLISLYDFRLSKVYVIRAGTIHSIIFDRLMTRLIYLPQPRWDFLGVDLVIFLKLRIYLFFINFTLIHLNHWVCHVFEYPRVDFRSLTI